MKLSDEEREELITAIANMPPFYRKRGRILDLVYKLMKEE